MEGKWRLVYWFKAQRLENINPADEHGPVSFCSRLVDDHQEKRFQLASLPHRAARGTHPYFLCFVCFFLEERGPNSINFHADFTVGFAAFPVAINGYFLCLQNLFVRILGPKYFPTQERRLLMPGARKLEQKADFFSVRETLVRTSEISLVPSTLTCGGRSLQTVLKK